MPKTSNYTQIVKNYCSRVVLLQSFDITDQYKQIFAYYLLQKIQNKKKRWKTLSKPMLTNLKNLRYERDKEFSARNHVDVNA